jgi:hypothetical protein
MQPAHQSLSFAEAILPSRVLLDGSNGFSSLSFFGCFPTQARW